MDQLNEDELEVDEQIISNNENNHEKKIVYKQQQSNDDSNCEKYPFPSVSELNIRLRRVITCFQKLHKKEILLSKRNAEKQEKRLSKLASTQEKAVQRQMEKQTKWSRREESNFYRALSTFGVDYDKTTNSYRWDRFREIGQLDKKLDETLTDYFNTFYYMCKKVCNKIDENDQLPTVDFMVEPISEERASRCIQRVELLNKLRLDIINHEHFEERIKLCKTSIDLPDWWIPVKHDKELITAAARYGITRTDYYYLNDTDFTFKEYLTKYMKHIEFLMGDNKIDPIQYYFLNQSKIQQSFKEILDKEIAKEAGIEIEEAEEAVPNAVETKLDNNNSAINMSINSDHSKLQIDESFVEDEFMAESKKVINSIIKEIENDIAVDVKKELQKEEINCKKEQTEEDQQLQQQKIAEMVLSMQQQHQGLDGESKAPLGVPMIMWPKDRIICHRLENIIHCIETNEWPERNPFLLNAGQGDGLMQSAGIVIPPHYLNDKPSSPMLSTSDINDYYDNNSNDKDFKMGFDYDSLIQKTTSGSSSKYQKPKRGRPPKLDDPANKIRHLLTQLPPGADENDIPLSELMNAAKASLFGGSSPSHIPTSSSSHSSVTAPFLEPGEIVRKNAKEALLNNLSSSNSQALNNNNNKRSRKPTKDPISSLFLGPNMDPDERVAVINVEDGTRLSGDDAPKRIDLADFLSQNKNYLPEQSDIFELAFVNRRTSKSIKQNHPSTPHDALSFLQSISHNSNDNINNKFSNKSSIESNNRQSLPNNNNSNLQNNEPNIFNVCYINKVTNKKFVPSKPPTWKNLANFFEKNPDIYIDPSSNELVRTKYGRHIPDMIKSRILPSKSNSKQNSSSQSSQLNNKEKPNSNNNNGSSSNKQNNVIPASLSNNNNKDKKQQGKSANPASSSSSSSLSNASTSQQPQITYPPLSPNSAASLAGLSELLMQQGSFNPLAAGLPSFMAAAAAQGGPMGLPFGGLGFNPFLMPPFGSTPFGSSPLEDFMKQLGAQKPEDFNLEAFTNATNGMLTAINSPKPNDQDKLLEKESRSDNKGSNNKQHAREKEQRNENLHESRKETLQREHSKESSKDRNKESEDRTPKDKQRVRERDWEREKEKERDSNKEKSSKSHSNNNNTSIQSASSSSSSKRTNDSTNVSSKKDQNQSSKQNKESSKEKSSTSQQLQNLSQQEKFMQEMMNLSQFAATSSFPNNFYLNPLGFPTPQLDSSSPSPTPDAATAAALSQLGSVPSSLDFSLLLNNLMMNPLFGASMPPPPPSSSSSDFANKLPVDILSALTAAAQSNSGLLDPSQLLNSNKNLLMDLMHPDDTHNAASSLKSGSSSHHKKQHSVESMSRSSSSSQNHSSNNKHQTKSSSESSQHHHSSSSSSKQHNSNSANKHQSNKQQLSSKHSSTESFQGLDLSIKKPNRNKNENENILKSPAKK